METCQREQKSCNQPKKWNPMETCERENKNLAIENAA